jgi:hypothetical protein
LATAKAHQAVLLFAQHGFTTLKKHSIAIQRHHCYFGVVVENMERFVMAAKAKKSAKTADLLQRPHQTDGDVDFAEIMSGEHTYKGFKVWLLGTTPLIVHSWSEKAKREMLQKQLKETKTGKDARRPEEDFTASLYEMGEEKGKTIYGFPVTGIKNAILTSAHKDKGIARSAVQSALWLDADMVRVRPARAGAICDMPLVRVYGSDPEMREDMVRVGVGLNKKASLAYRGQFTTWGVCLTGQFNPVVLSPKALYFLMAEAGMGVGIGEWRNEKRGMFGSFHIADAAEQAAWEEYASGRGPLPKAGARPLLKVA